MGGLATILLVFGLLAVPVGPAKADVGDGYLSCNVGEICFKKHRDTNYTSGIKHFWYSQRHDNWTWGGGGSGSVVWSASMWWNRDTQCAIYIVDGYSGQIRVNSGGSNYSWVGLLWNDANYAHSRCSVHQNWGT